MKALLLLTCILLASACQPQGEETPALTVGSVIHGSHVSSDHLATTFSAVLMHESAGFYCSGIVIGKKAILTAAHCLYGLSSVDIKVAFGSVAAKTTAAQEVDRIVLHSDYKDEEDDFDIGIIILKEEVPATVAPIPLYAGGPLVGDFPVESYGFSSYTEDVVKDMFGYLEGVATDFTPNELSQEEKVGLHGKLLLARYVRDQEIGLYQYSGGVCSGDSGGPTVLNLNGKKVLMGINWAVTTTPNDETSCSREGAVTPISYFLSWIKENAAEELTLSWVGRDSLPEEDVNCIETFQDFSDKMIEANKETDSDLCQQSDELSRLLEDSLSKAKVRCQSPLAHFYPTFIENTQKKFIEKCEL